MSARYSYIVSCQLRRRSFLISALFSHGCWKLSTTGTYLSHRFGIHWWSASAPAKPLSELHFLLVLTWMPANTTFNGEFFTIIIWRKCLVLRDHLCYVWEQCGPRDHFLLRGELQWEQANSSLRPTFRIGGSPFMIWSKSFSKGGGLFLGAPLGTSSVALW